LQFFICNQNQNIKHYGTTTAISDYPAGKHGGYSVYSTGKIDEDYYQR